jgi:molybdopterin molybdotransferase
VNTGAPLPEGADAVVPVEATRGAVEILEGAAPGAFVLRRAALARAGDEVASGMLTPERAGVCAAVGADPVRVRRRPRVALLATGTELHAQPGAHEIRNSNGPMRRGLLAACAVDDLGSAPDDRAALDAAVARGLRADVLVTTGGVSKGEHDLVRPVLEACGLEVVFHGVALQPGKPLLFATHAGGAVFALPGNPASALVCADLFLRPDLAVLAGRGFDEVLRERSGTLAAPVRAAPPRRRVLPCLRDGETIHPLPWRGSSDLYTLARGNGYLVVEAGRDLRAGDRATCLVPERFGP